MYISSMETDELVRLSFHTAKCNQCWTVMFVSRRDRLTAMLFNNETRQNECVLRKAHEFDASVCIRMIL